ncbi:MAG: YicC family protein [Bacteroidales bacterium]|nr:YicC family protein [Bacteroidales bacterium]
MKSMTGFAKRQFVIKERNLTIEIKTLNSKTMDANVKLPTSLRSRELELRAMLNQLERGKIDFSISEEQTSTSATGHLDSALVAQRVDDMRAVAATLGTTLPDATLLQMVMQQSDVWTNAGETEWSDDEWTVIRSEAEAAIAEVDATRQHEGAVLEQDFHKHVDLIERYLQQVPQYEAERIATARERIQGLMADAGIKEVDANRFEQELIYYLEKLDITEEKVRLQKHIDYFRDVMAHEPSSGKKLGFIAQEMGREINTTGSKANHVEIQRLVVAMKDELEKIKEQLGNIL